MTPDDVRRCLANLENTYLVRLFAVFEDYLREVWKKSLKRKTVPQTAGLLNAVASHQHIRDGDLFWVHKVRDCRNTLIHGGHAELVSLPKARRDLCVFFGWMPQQW